MGYGLRILLAEVCLWLLAFGAFLFISQTTASLFK